MHHGVEVCSRSCIRLCLCLTNCLLEVVIFGGVHERIVFASLEFPLGFPLMRALTTACCGSSFSIGFFVSHFNHGDGKKMIRL